MARGRKIEKTYTSTHGGDGPSGDVRQIAAMRRGPTSVQDRLHGPSPVEMRRCLTNGECPFCGRQFRNMALHINRSHGVGRDELKDMAGIPRSQSVCSPAYSELCADRGRRQFAENPDRKLKPRNLSGPRKFSPGGKRIQREKAAKGRVVQGAVDGGLPASLTEHNRQLYLERTKNRDAAIAKMVQDGASSKEVRERFKISSETVRRAMQRHGVEANFYSRRPSRRGQ